MKLSIELAADTTTPRPTRYNAAVPTTAADDSIERAYAACEALARSHYENFPVASLLLPKAMRPHIAAVYAFARHADDLADEGTVPAADRRAALDDWLRRLDNAIGSAGFHVVNPDDLILMATAHSIRALDLPRDLFADLVSAFAQDTVVTRYESWEHVRDYCRRSANPVGRLVLRIAGYRAASLDGSSDELCTALQLTNFWQDFGRDWQSGRLYVPRDVQRAEGADESQLTSGTLPAAWGAVMARCVAFTWQRFAAGCAVCDGVRGRLRAELRFTWLGGTRILERVDRSRLALLHFRPTLAVGDIPPLLLRALLWRRSSLPSASDGA